MAPLGGGPHFRSQARTIARKFGQLRVGHGFAIRAADIALQLQLCQARRGVRAIQPMLRRQSLRASLSSEPEFLLDRQGCLGGIQTTKLAMAENVFRFQR
jgi:hypothetical protein